MNPYEKWLGISSGTQTPDYFQLLGISRDEHDVETIKASAQLQARKLKKYQEGKHADACEKILKRIRKAYKVLTSPELRADYLTRLAEKEKRSGDVEVVPIQTAMPVDIAEPILQVEPELLEPLPAAQPYQSAIPAQSRLAKPPAKTSQMPPTSKNNLPLIIGGAVALAVLLISGVVALFYLMDSEAPDKLAKQIPVPNEVATPDSEALEPASDEKASSPSPSVKSQETLPEVASQETTPDSAPSDASTPRAPAISSPKITQSESQESKADSEEPPIEIVPRPVTPVAPVANVDAPDVETTDEPIQPEEISELPETSSAPRELVQTNLPDPDDEPVTTQGDLAVQAKAILKKNCAYCHDDEGTDEGGFDFVMNREKMIAAGYVRPKDPSDSLLLERMKSEDAPMPPEGEAPRPSMEEIKIVRDWIRAGAAPFEATEKQPFVSTEQLFELISRDLAKLSQRDREYMRYFTVTHLGNAGYSPEELKVYQQALAKLLNSLSWSRSLAGLNSIKDCETTFRIDLRDLKWNVKNWELILLDYPYGVVFDSREALRVRTETDCEIPLVRADWFVAMASRPPLYHDLLQLPTTDEKLEQYLQVDIPKNLEEERVVRSGFARSGVSQNNRMIERHDSIFGTYWKSYDFAGNTGRKNLFEYPLGPGASVNDFEHDGGEIIFSLPNGMLAYMLTDAFGRRIDKGPTEIVSDPRQPDRAVVNGVSCMSCHYGGFIPKDDEIRKHVLANSQAYKKIDDILALYPAASETDEKLNRDTKEYLKKLSSPEIGIEKPTRSGEPIVLVANRFENEVDSVLAAAELGITNESLSERLDRLTDQNLTRQVGALKVAGGVIKRETFNDVFVSLVDEFELGERSAIAASDAAQNRVAARRRTGNATGNRRGVSGSRNAAVDQAIEEGKKHRGREEWTAALAKFEEAARIASDPDQRIQAIELAIPFYERMETINKLVESYRVVLSSVTGTGASFTANNAFFESIRTYIDGQKGFDSLRWNSWNQSPSAMLDLMNLRIPTSAANTIERELTKELEQNPNAEAIMFVLHDFYSYVREDRSKRKKLIFDLQGICEARDEPLPANFQMDLARIYVSSGEPEKGAKLLQKLNRSTAVARSSVGHNLIAEGEAWMAAGNDDEAVVALKKATKWFTRQNSSSIYSSKLRSIGQHFIKLNRPELAIEPLKFALQNDTSNHRTEETQKSLATALAMIEENDGAAEAENDSGTKKKSASKSRSNNSRINDLLDPNLVHRRNAEKYEKGAGSNPSTIVSMMLRAYEEWKKADEPEKAMKALEKASKTQRRIRTGYGLHSNHEKIGQAFLNEDKLQKAFDHFAEAMKHAKYERDIEKYQNELLAILDEDGSIKVSTELRRMIDPNYKYRAMAQQEEAKKPYNASSELDYLVKAAELWASAGDQDDVARTGKKAESAVRRIQRSTSSTPSEVRSLIKLVNAYEKVELFDPAVRTLVIAMDRTNDDSKAEEYHARIEAICADQGVSKPKLSSEIAVKLDPLNRYRVKARKEEAEAKDGHSAYSMATDYLDAMENWIQAEEKAEAIRVGKLAGKTLLSDKEETLFDSNCKKLAELYEKIEMNREAIKFYEHSLSKETSKYHREDLEKAIERLKSQQ